MPIDFQALLDIARVNEEEVTDKQFDMGSWKSYCGSVGCMIGNWILRGHEEKLAFSESEQWDPVPYFNGQLINESDYETVGARLGLRKIEVDFLFGPVFQLDRYLEWRELSQSPTHDRQCQTRLQNIRRLRLFIYYRLRKAEIFADYERARHQEGDWGVASYAKEMAGCP